MVSACATTNTVVMKPECQGSLIYSKLENPDTASTIASLVGFETFRALRKQGQDMQPVFKDMQKVIDILDSKNLTYATFFLMVAATNKTISQYGGIEIMFLSMNAEQFYNNASPMHDCDRQYLKRNLSNTLMLMKMIE
ncbi:MAG TPA: hypothetical protein DGG95_06445 [Cytophagales bacterium]|nr:hypothetical protein [Cytophagales bacterium]